MLMPRNEGLFKDAWKLVPGDKFCDKVTFLRGIYTTLSLETKVEMMKKIGSFCCDDERLCIRKEDVNFFRMNCYDFIPTSLYYLISLKYPMTYEGNLEDAREVIINKQALLQIGNRIVCSCGSGFPCTETTLNASMGAFKAGLHLKCTKCNTGDLSGEYFPLFQHDRNGNSLTEITVLSAIHLSGDKNERVKRFVELLEGKPINFRETAVNQVRLMASEVVEKAGAGALISALTEWLDEEFPDMCFDVGFTRPERTGANNGANIACGAALSQSSMKVILASVGNKRKENERIEKERKANPNLTEKIMTSKRMESKVASQTYKFVEDIFQRKRKSRQEEQTPLVRIKTDKANKSTGGLLKKWLTETEYEWSWCIWHERKCVKKMFSRIFSVGKLATKVKYLNTKNLSRKSILGLFYEKGWPPPDFVEGSAPPVEVYRSALRKQLGEAKVSFSTIFKTPELAATYCDFCPEDRQKFRESVGNVKYCTTMNPTEEEVEKQWWTKFVQITYRNREEESKANDEVSWLCQNEKNSIQKKNITIFPAWLVSNCERFEGKLGQHVYDCSRKATGENLPDRARSMYSLWQNFVPHHRLKGGSHKMCQGQCKELGTNFRHNRSVDGLDDDEVLFMSAVLNMQYFSYGNFFQYMCSGATTSPCECFFSTWAKHGRDKNNRNEDWYILTTILRNVIEVNARRSSEQIGEEYKPFETFSNMMDQILRMDDCHFDLDEFVLRNQGILCQKEIRVALRAAFPILGDTADVLTTEPADGDNLAVADDDLGAFNDSDDDFDDDDLDDDVVNDHDDEDIYIGEGECEGETGVSTFGRRRPQMDYSNPSRARDTTTRKRKRRKE